MKKKQIRHWEVFITLYNILIFGGVKFLSESLLVFLLVSVKVVFISSMHEVQGEIS